MTEKRTAMETVSDLKIIAHIRSDFGEKFGIPRQSGLVDTLTAQIVFEPEYRDANAFRGLEGYSHIWLLWKFSECVLEKWEPTVLPPRLGGKTRMGVFATRSPFRPNPIGLSSVRLLEVRQVPKLGPVLVVAGADLMDGTPIYDIKPYLPFTDSHPDATAGFAETTGGHRLRVVFPNALLAEIPEDRRAALLGVLEQDPRPSYQNDPTRRYGFRFAGRDVRFFVEGDTLTVCEII
ncbi:MAG: tRNA (N6-threonylcarbamoyladenosine(37)-N6)-methyltransferase TrmO [Oscillospiraceae bacterium]|nr:tRNA (N6-threonylcarbamoyladenosine(37)-N6)-methyltransferase TrmO [Oscillospiraceae bacterium]